MRRTRVDLSTSGINSLLDQLAYQEVRIKRGAEEVARRLADMGATKIDVGFMAAYYDGDEDHYVNITRLGEMKYRVEVVGRTVLFVEFGSGLIGYGHPEVHGYGPGTYPGKGYWNRPNGWFFTGKDGETHHSHGNPPNAPVYNTIKELEDEMERVVREVFND